MSEVHKTQLNLSRQMIPPTIAGSISQVRTTMEFKECTEVGLNPFNIRRNFERLVDQIKRSTTKSSESKESEEEIPVVEDVSNIADEFQRQNPELQAEDLEELLSVLLKEDSSDAILEKVLTAYPDQALANDALDFLIRSSTGTLKEKCIAVQKQLNELYTRQIKAGQNTMETSQEFAKKNLDSAQNLRNLYRDITGNPRDPATLFAELANSYTYSKMKEVISFMLKALGADLRSKGPSIEKGELHRLFTETRSMQAILGVYHFFEERMGLIIDCFEKQNLFLTGKITFENLARLFVKFILERYPSLERLLQIGNQLGIDQSASAKMIILSQMLQAVRKVSPRLYHSEQHRLDVLKSFIDYLEELEDELEEEDD